MTLSTCEVDLSCQIDFVEAALNELQFLRVVDQYPTLFQGALFKNALRRYEMLWLPLFKSNNLDGRELQAPLDVEWVWQTHILDGGFYEEDCRNIVFREVDHRINVELEKEEALFRARTLWEKAYPTEPFEVDLEHLPSYVPKYICNLRCDLQEASCRLRNLYHNTSLPHYRDSFFLMSSLRRYKQHLILTKENPDIVLVPCCDVDLIWKTHLLHPSSYKADTRKFLGYVLKHPEAKIGALEISKHLSLESDTEATWNKYEMAFKRPGAIFRGECPPPLPFQPKAIHRNLAMFEFEMELSKFEIENFENDKKFSFTLQLDDETVIWKKKLKGGSHILEGDHQPLAQFVVNTDDKTSLTLSFYQKKLFSKTPKMCHTVDLAECLQTAIRMESETNIFRIPIPLFGPADRKAYITIKTCGLPKPLSYRFTLSPEPESAKFLHPADVVSTPKTVLGREILTKQRMPCELLVYRVYSHSGKDAFTCRVLNAEPAGVMVLEIVDDDDGNTVASAQLINDNIFPSPLEPLEDPSKCITNSMSDGETVLLIRGRVDWAVCMGVRQSDEQSLDEERNVVQVKFFRLGDGQGWCEVRKTGHLLLIQVNKKEEIFMAVNPDEGQILLPINLEDVPECVATAVGVMLLPSLCYTAKPQHNQPGGADISSVVLRCPSLSRFSSSRPTTTLT
ncbi:uncharacterized protein LOC111340328 [Stylophora pistillata]|nr:uncharacterized protein LOC111340328 [Stylophora pistillata]